MYSILLFKVQLKIVYFLEPMLYYIIIYTEMKIKYKKQMNAINELIN